MFLVIFDENKIKKVENLQKQNLENERILYDKRRDLENTLIIKENTRQEVLNIDRVSDDSKKK